ncbi:MAG: hypothetical protein H7Y38_16315, partial [Armatimonadetes bacterium]|nr:hypothetical protein [Armatimonadota bacterium]
SQDLGLTGGVGAGNANNGDSLSFGEPTLGYENLSVSVAHRRSGTGFNSVQFAYSLSGGAFVNLGAAYTPVGNYTGSLRTFDLSGIVGVATSPNTTFRLTFSGATGTTGTGNNRLDNIQINAAPVGTAVVPEAGSLALFAAPMLGLGAIVLRRRNK